ncbi:MAG TPA: C1 family peptidase [Candidatus Hydrogenedentes bacterium]|nr:C1 family peptidase [Candidatus Hydrogenedentota bacterium]
MKQTKYFFSGMLYALVMCGIVVSSPAMAQLSSEDIAALRAEGQAKGWTFTVGENSATKRSVSELAGYVVPEDKEQMLREAPPARPVKASSKAFPSRLDWRELTPGGMPPVRDQGGCGSCWAFSTVGALECAIKIHDGINVNLSEQWILGCVTGLFWYGCDGGITAHNWHKTGGKTDSCGGNGAVYEVDVPYTGSDGTCTCPVSHHYWLRDWHYVNANPLSVPPVEDMKQAIMDYGPITSSLVMTKSVIAYTGGVFNDHTPTKALPDHSIVLVGWDDSQGTNGAWIMRNSWGDDWGDNGYGYFEYEVNQIGFGADYILYGDPVDDLTVTPTTGLNSTGPVGGPFTPDSASYTLENTGANALNWTSSYPAWVTVQPSSGTLGASATQQVTVTINAASLAVGEYSGTVSFTNGGTAVSQTRNVSLTITPPEIYSFDLTTNPGWTMTGNWAFGQPQGNGSNNADPTSGYTGNNVYGYNLAGDYEDDMDEEYLTTLPLDFTGVTGVELRFMRWLGVESSSYDQASVRVSNNGTTWTAIWNHSGSSLSETAWTECVYDISSVADNQPSVYVRWVMGDTDGSETYSGWNIDDILFRGNLSSEGEEEGEGAAEGTLEGSPSEGEEGEIEGAVEGEGQEEGQLEGIVEGESEGIVEGELEGSPVEGEEGEGTVEGENEGAQETAYFVVANPLAPQQGTYILPLNDAADIAQARAIVANPFSTMATIVMAHIAVGGSEGEYINCDPFNGGQIWSWRISEFLGFAEMSAELYDGTAAYVEENLESWMEMTGGTIGFWSYRVVAEFFGGCGTEGEDEGELTEGEGAAQEGVIEGALEGEGVLEGETEGMPNEGILEGIDEGESEGDPVEGEGVEEGAIEGMEEGEGVEEGAEEGEGIVEGAEEGEGEVVEGEGTAEGEGGVAEGEGTAEGEGQVDFWHSADQDQDNIVSLSELLRLIQFFNSGGYHCAPGTEDGYAPGVGDVSCAPHASDYTGQDWEINLSELLRLIQFFNSGGYHTCEGSEDGFCPGLV